MKKKTWIFFTSSIQLPGGSAPWTPRPNFGPFFIFQKNIFLIQNITFSLNTGRKFTSKIMKIAINRPRDLSKRIQHQLIYMVKSNLSLVACIWSHFMKNDCFGIQNHEKNNLDFFHKLHPVTGGLRPPDPPAEFWIFFFIFPKSCFWFKKVTFSLKSLIFYINGVLDLLRSTGN